MYADADFFFALLKENDWLKKHSEELYKSGRKEIWTSVATMIEILFRGSAKKINTVEALLALQDLAPVVPLLKDHLVLAAELKSANPALDTMDAIHAAVAQSAGEKKIISSDKIFEKLGFERVKLER